MTIVHERNCPCSRCELDFAFNVYSGAIKSRAPARWYSTPRKRLVDALTGVASRWVRALISLAAIVSALALAAGAALLLRDPGLSTIAGQIVGAPAAIFSVLYTSGWAFENRNLRWWWWHDAN